MNSIHPAIQRFNQLMEPAAIEEMRRLCGSLRWCQTMVEQRPFTSDHEIKQAGEKAFSELSTDDWLEAFAHHPRIGDLQSLQMKYGGNREWSAGEQQGASIADDQTLLDLAEGNAVYERQNGFIFIVCATGKSAGEMLQILNSRLVNSRNVEVENAATEQKKITQLRLQKWLETQQG